MKVSLPKLTFVLGGSRSGKSRFAQTLCGDHRSVLFWATGMACDREMKKRIANHRRKRPKHWKLIEEPRDLLKGLGSLQKGPSKIVVLDSLTTWAGNILETAEQNAAHLKHLQRFLAALTKFPARWIIVSDEVGMGVVPRTRSGRNFRDFLGDANQMTAAAAKHVYWLNAGIPLKIK